MSSGLLERPAAAPSGWQEPPVWSAPKWVQTSGNEVVGLARMAGLVLDPWQEFVLRESCGERGDGKWSAYEVGLLCSRQNGKGAILEARELAGLFLFGEELILHSAHEFKTAKDAYRRISNLIKSTPQLHEQVDKYRYSNEEVGIELKDGRRLRFVARSGGSGRGFSADCIILDEAFNLGDDAMSALMPTMSARPNPQIWYTSSAGVTGKKGHDPAVLGRVWARGHAGDDPELAFFDWSAQPGDDRLDPLTWAKANPGLGIRLTEETIRRELRAMDGPDFDAERLGLGKYPTPTAEGSGSVDMNQWREAADPDAARGADVSFGVDLGEDRTVCIAAAWRRADGATQVMVTVDDQGGPDCDLSTTQGLARVNALVKKWGGRVLLGGPAKDLADDISAPIDMVSGAEFASTCGRFADDLEQGNLRHGNQPVLNSSVRGARWRSVGTEGQRAWQLQKATGIGPLAAATRALHGVVNGAPFNVW